MTDVDLLKAMLAAGGVNLDVEDLLQYAPDSYTRSNMSSRLCRMREKGLCTSEYQDKRNYWTVSNKGASMIDQDWVPDKMPDIELETGIPVSEENQTVAVDILPDILPDISPTRSYEITAGCGIDYSFPPRKAYAVADTLVSESQKLHRRNRFADLPDALFVLESLGDYCADMPGYQSELKRIADYLRENAE